MAARTPSAPGRRLRDDSPSSIKRQFEQLDALSRERPLTLHESIRLERCVREMDRKGGRPKRVPLGDRRYKGDGQ